MPDWQRFADVGNRLGSAEASATIVTFSDFQCRYCAALALSLNQLLATYPSDVSVVFRHFPLQSIHPAAYGAAAASECAAKLGRFREFHDAAFRNQDSVGARAWRYLANAAGLTDTVTFVGCIGSAEAHARVEQDLEAGYELGIRGTPFVMINGAVVRGVAPLSVLDSLVTSVLTSESAAANSRQ